MRSNDENAPGPGLYSAGAKVDLRLALSGGTALLPWRSAACESLGDLSTEAVLAAAARQVGRPGAFLLGGGEPLRRADLASLLTGLAQLRPDDIGLCSAGSGLSPGVARRLVELGVRRMHVPFHCARQDAHDWLFGKQGALKSAHRAIRVCVDAGLPVVADIVLTRPTMAHLAETVEVLFRLGVRSVIVRRLRWADAPGDEFVPLSPRLGLLAPSLERAAALALEHRMQLSLRDLPLCSAPRLRPLFASPDREIWLAADGAPVERAAAEIGCADCPGLPRCAGMPRDYVERFGWEELASREERAARVAESVADQQRVDTTQPMVFTWRGPHRVRCEDCGDGAHEKGRGAQAYESTRAIRARLVDAARYRPAVLRLFGADLLAHPQAAALIFDALRLFPRVEVAGEASAVVDWSDLDLRRLKDVARFDVALYGPDAVTHDGHCGIPGAFAATLRAAARLREAKIPVGAYAILHDARAVAAFAAAWGEGRLPGAPRFRLSARGSSLQELAESARSLADGAARVALLAMLPRCLSAGEAGGPEIAAGLHGAVEQRRVHGGRSLPYQPGGSDPIGTFDKCHEDAGACALAGCPGRAAGWQETAGSQRWSGSI